MSRLLPDSETPVIVNGIATKASESAMLTKFPRANGVGSVTVSGTEATGDVVSITLTGKMFTGGSLVKSYTTIGGDTDAITAEQLAKLFAADAQIQALGIQVSGVKGLVTFTWPGPLSAFCTISSHTTAAETFTIVQFTGGSGPVIPSALLITGEYYKFMWNGQVIILRPDRPLNVASDLLGALVAAQAPIT